MQRSIAFIANQLIGGLGAALVRKRSLQRLREHQRLLKVMYGASDDDLDVIAALPDANARRLFELLEHSKSQWRQDLFVLSTLDFKRQGYFVEFGATDGVNLSNTFLLEKEFGWTGILAEPARCWHRALRANRSCHIETDCVWRTTGATLDFAETGAAELSTLSSYVGVDLHAETRRRESVTYQVGTVSLNDLLDRHDAPSEIDYLSIDTEGSELEILRAFDFTHRRIRIITCEHNYTEARGEIGALLSRAGYERRFAEISAFDDWYVLRGD